MGARRELGHSANDAAARASLERHFDCFQLQQVRDGDLLNVGDFGCMIECTFHVYECLIVRQADAVFEPVMNFRCGESPVTADPPGGKLTAFGQFLHGCWHHVQVCCQAVDVEVVLCHACIVRAVQPP